MALAAMVLALAALLQATEATHLVIGELVKVDLDQRAVVLKVGGEGSREVAIAVDEDTRIVSRGRVLRLEELRSGDPAKVLCVDKGGRHRARVVKTGASRYAVPAPSPRP